MNVQLDQLVATRVLRCGHTTNSSEREVALTAHRFGGMLKRPVPIPEMVRVWGIDERDSKVVADWSGTLDAVGLVRIGDVLKIEGRTYSIRGVRQTSHIASKGEGECDGGIALRPRRN
jgi:hypothetical protein